MMWSRRWPAITDSPLRIGGPICSLAPTRGRWFFFYGTLMHDHANAQTRSILPLFAGGGRRAFVRGRLRGVQTPQGWYPVLCTGDGRVSGRLYRAGHGFQPTHLRALDVYEGFDRRRPSWSEYVRRAIRVRVAGGGIVKAQAYWYNRAVHPGLPIIPGGDFTAFARRRRLCVFAAD